MHPILTFCIPFQTFLKSPIYWASDLLLLQLLIVIQMSSCGHHHVTVYAVTQPLRLFVEVAVASV